MPLYYFCPAFGATYHRSKPFSFQSGLVVQRIVYRSPKPGMVVRFHPRPQPKVVFGWAASRSTRDHSKTLFPTREGAFFYFGLVVRCAARLASPVHPRPRRNALFLRERSVFQFRAGGWMRVVAGCAGSSETMVLSFQLCTCGSSPVKAPMGIAAEVGLTFRRYVGLA
jgi:hypothetical protein